jgi:hypothetical protein
MQKNQVISSLVTKDLQDSVVVFSPLIPGDYSARIIRDVNGNGKQDAGNYLLKKRPEQEKKLTFQTLKPDWTLEADVYWDKTKLSITRDSLSTSEKLDK